MRQILKCVCRAFVFIFIGFASLALAEAEVGTVGPQSVSLDAQSAYCSSGNQTVNLSLNLPAETTTKKVDVFFLYDHTGSFASLLPQTQTIFSGLVAQLQTELPGVDMAFGAAGFEDYGGPGSAFTPDCVLGILCSSDSTQRPFILFQPVISTNTPNFSALMNQALTLPPAPQGKGSDGPESNYEGLYQLATGKGFDGDASGSMLDGGLAGAASTITTNTSTGDVASFSSNVGVTSGAIGGGGFREGSTRIVLLTADNCPAASFEAGVPIPTAIAGANGRAFPTSAFACASGARRGYVANGKSTATNTIPGAVAPQGATTVPDTIAALNRLGISVVGLAPGGHPITNPTGESGTPSEFLSALALTRRAD